LDLAQLRTIEVALVHTTARPASVKRIAERAWEQFPAKDSRVNRELAILLTYCRREHLLDQPVHARLLAALDAARDDRQQQIHYFYCLRLLHEGWTAEEKGRLLAWYDGTRAWSGGFSFTPFLENILRDLGPVWTAEDRTRALAAADQYPGA